MILKTADDKTADLDTLNALLDHPDASAATKKNIEQEIRAIKSGIKGENDTAYEIDFHYSQNDNWAVIHDLRLVFNDRVAQFDHLLINRLMEIWVIESKRLVEGIAINEQGECATFWNGKPHGIASPHEQNAKHLKVLQSVCEDGSIELPKRVGMTIKPSYHGLVVVSKNARISRPDTPGWWQDDLIKADQIRTRIGKSAEEGSPLQILKLLSSESLKEFAWSLTALHTPITFDWPAKFGLSMTGLDTHSSGSDTQPVQPPEQPESPASASKSRYFCAACRAAVSEKVAKFCWSHKPRFGGQVYCYNCQPKFPNAARSQ